MDGSNIFTKPGRSSCRRDGKTLTRNPLRREGTWGRRCGRRAAETRRNPSNPIFANALLPRPEIRKKRVPSTVASPPTISIVFNFRLSCTSSGPTPTEKLKNFGSGRGLLQLLRLSARSTHAWPYTTPASPPTMTSSKVLLPLRSPGGCRRHVAPPPSPSSPHPLPKRASRVELLVRIPRRPDPTHPFGRSPGSLPPATGEQTSEYQSEGHSESFVGCPVGCARTISSCRAPRPRSKRALRPLPPSTPSPLVP